MHQPAGRSLPAPLDPKLAIRTHFAYLDGIRGLMALFVVATHAYWTVWPLEYGRQPSPGLRPWLSPLLYSRFAITVFIVLSGFCLSLAVVRDGGVLRGGLRRFFRGRARRIIPPFYAGVLLSLLLIWTVIGKKTGTHWDLGIPVGWHGYAGNVLLVQNLVGPGQINGAYWSIGAEVQCYLLFPLLVWIWARRGIAVSTACGVALGFVGLMVVDRLREHGFVLPAATPMFFALFALGMFGAATACSEQPALVRLRERVPWVALALAASLAIAVLDWHWSFVEAVRHWPYLDLLAGVATVTILIATSRSRPSRLRSFLALRPLPALGVFSFSIYLVHLPLLQVEWQYGFHRLGLAAPWTFALLAVVGTALIVVAAYGFHLAFEKPFMSSRQRRAAEGEFVETVSDAARERGSEDAHAPVLEGAGQPSTAAETAGA